MNHVGRTIVAAFDSAAMAVYAYVNTGGFGHLIPDLVLWGSAAAASIAAFVVATGGPGIVGWIAIGYVLFAGLLVLERPELLLVALAIALMSVVQRPRSSLALGVLVAALAAFGWRILVVALLRAA
ncbi:MAG TPA: hypothetical protein VHG53_06115 [Candidatus Limnocylindria bacterium]|nr:hypothetical protein [Candidatus Limnocylindria bacterium]